MPRALDLLGQMGKGFLPAPVTSGIDIPKDPFVRERGASNLNLIDSGRQQIHQIGMGLAGKLAHSTSIGRPRQVKIYSSPWNRTKETAGILAQHLGGVPVQEIPELAPQSQGSLEGEKNTDVQEIVRQLKLQTPRNEPPGESKFTGARGESQEAYEQRLLPAIDRIMQESERHPSLVSIVAAHSGDMRAIHAWANAGFPKDYSVQRDDTLTDSVGHARTDRLSINNEGRWNYEPGVDTHSPGPLRPGVYLQRHGDTEFNTARPELLEGRGRPGERVSTVESYRDHPTNPSVAGNASGTPPPTGSY